MNNDGLKQKLISQIDPVELVRETTHPDWDGNESTKLDCPMAETRHESGDDSSPSLSINPSTGEFQCFGCGWKGTSIVGYYTDVVCSGNFKQALAKLFSKYIREVISSKEIGQLHRKLTSSYKLLLKISATRGWTKDTIKRLKIGWDTDKKRTVIPIFNLQGYCLDVRYHDTLYRAPLQKEKRIPILGNRSSRTGDWFPLNPHVNPFKEKEVWLVEGEPDAIIATQDGLNCVTLTGGAGVWKGIDYEILKSLSGKDVVICFDNDKAGQNAAVVLSERLASVGVRSLRNLIPPKGNDISDFFLKYGGSAQQLRQYATASKYLIKPNTRSAEVIPLSDTGKAEHIGKQVRAKVIISGKADSPQAIPKRLKLSCATDDFCSACPCKSTGESEYYVMGNDPNVLEWLYARSFDKRVKDELGLAAKCRMNVEVLEWQNMESLTLIPSLSNSSSEDEGKYTTRHGYYIGHGIESNQNYDILATPTINPRTKESVLLVEEAKGTYDSITQFELTSVEIEELKSLFNKDPLKTIKEVVSLQSRAHTHIYGRPELHTAVDLCFHSPSEFSFAGVQVPKGSMEILLLGDTRCGKGQVAEGLVRFYDVGTVVSGENSSFMGLLGGAQKIGDGFQLSWGAFPLNNGRLVVVDEFSGLSSEVLGRLSRVRSEGIAEINKGGINTKTKANARVIWIANPRNGRSVDSFPNGVSAIEDLIKTQEDIARFDLAVVVQKGEVDIETINKIHSSSFRSRYTRESLRKVLLWGWSRRSEHIVFSSNATEFILRSASELAQIYSPSIPLIQGENARFKIAKLAASIAIRNFSTEDGKFVKVTEEHARVAVKLIDMFYGKRSMGYKQYSTLIFDTQSLVEVNILDEFFNQWPNHVKQLLVDGLLSVDKFGVREIQDWCDVDAQIAKKFAGKFVRCRATAQQVGGLYIKKPAFIKYLRRIKKRLK